MPYTPPLLASRFVALDDGMSLDLATGGRVWIERRVLDTIARTLWPPLMSRLWALWHPALAPCVDFGFVNAHEWFEAYAVRPPDAADSFSAQARSLPAFLRAHDVVCGLKPLGSGRRSSGLLPTLPSEQTPESTARWVPGLGCAWWPGRSTRICRRHLTIADLAGHASGASTRPPAAGGVRRGVILRGTPGWRGRARARGGPRVGRAARGWAADVVAGVARGVLVAGAARARRVATARSPGTGAATGTAGRSRIDRRRRAGRRPARPSASGRSSARGSDGRRAGVGTVGVARMWLAAMVACADDCPLGQRIAGRLRDARGHSAGTAP